MNRSSLLSLCVAASLLACSERPSGAPAVVDAGARAAAVPDAGPQVAAPAPSEVVDAGAGDAGAVAVDLYSPDAGSGTCSASKLSPRAQPAQPPLPAPVESMRSRIIAAAVACDYAALARLADEQGKSVRFSFGDGDDPVEYWREEERNGDPVLARMVRILQLPYAKQDNLYFWPAVHVTNAPKDWKAVAGIYTEQELRGMKEAMEAYLGLRVGISTEGDWQIAVAGD
ncbi:hypothetical protein ACLESO_43580 [Pyxidicoccus sp. 3LG]